MSIEKSLEQHEQHNDPRMARALQIKSELFDIANSFAGEKTGLVAMCLHQACNRIVQAEEELNLVR